MELGACSDGNLPQHQDYNPHQHQHDKCTDQVNPKNWKCSRNIKILIGFLLFALLIVVILHGVELSKKRPEQSCDPNSRPCPSLWIAYEGTCYYFSEEENNWNSSQDFCSSYNASLISITKEDKGFVMRLTAKHSYWIGLTRDPSQRWIWGNGKNSTLEVIGNGGNCAYLNDEGKASSSRCSTIHRWICHRPSASMGPNAAQ